ncbi:DUF3139 domain-containing protein [Paenibacillus sp. N3/727]|uniref:DUF3139 domain-containing protein n=1 Tax=Paenibacillus sp. N3/727 TaxID=2925845 RepID=UPI001F52EFEA|nr:DUF3139 domain-containing protein [Paenibacillus sp. N3/727]UNK20834.1 DUF3139 domain-containing protein [Paenibacillus sp. N3/727]
MKKIAWFFAIFVILLILGYILLQSKLNKLEDDLHSYLMNDKNYNEEDIVSIRARFSKMPRFPVYVIFEDELHVTYVYTDRNVGQWVQIGPSDIDIENGSYKHEDRD